MELEIVVGTKISSENQQREAKELVAKISDAGFQVVEANVAWPRDHYVFNDGNYVTKKEALFFGEGGYFLTGGDFVFISEKISGELRSSKIKEEAKKYYPKKRICVLPSGIDGLNFSSLDHIDLTYLFLPQKNTLIADVGLFPQGLFSFYKNRLKRIESICDREKINFLPYYGDKTESSRFFPLNCLVLEKEGREIIFANSNVPRSINFFESLGLEVIPVNFHETPLMTGSIRCRTNVKESSTDLRSLLNDEPKPLDYLSF